MTTYQPIIALLAQLTEAVKERDEARQERDHMFRVAQEKLIETAGDLATARARVAALEEALTEIKMRLSYAEQDAVSAAVKQGNTNLAWHCAAKALSTPEQKEEEL